MARERSSRRPGVTADAPIVCDDDYDEDESTRAREFSPGTMPTIEPELPTQNNSCDCGVYVLEYGEHVDRLRPRIDERALHANVPVLTEGLAQAGFTTLGFWTGWYLAPSYGFGTSGRFTYLERIEKHRATPGPGTYARM